MRTFGERMKFVRKKRGMSQAELAELMGLSVQTISRWERNGGMPDILQIAPLSKILGTSTDFLLGLNESEKDEIDAMWKKIDEGLESRSENLRSCDVIRLNYESVRELVKKYPMNIQLVHAAAYYGLTHLQNIKKGLFTLSEKEIQNLYIELERMLSSALKYDEHLDQKVLSAKYLARLHVIMGYYGKAELESEILGIEDRLEIMDYITNYKDDKSARIMIQKEIFYRYSFHLWRHLYNLGRAYSVLGAAQRENAKAVWRKCIQVLEAFDGALYPYDLWFWKCEAWVLLAKEYLRDSDFENVIDCAEHLAEESEKAWDLLKQAIANGKYERENIFFLNPFQSETKIPEEKYCVRLKEKLCRNFSSCYEDCDDRENNPIVKDERFQKLVERIQNLS